MCRECGRGSVHRPPDQGPGAPPATLMEPTADCSQQRWRTFGTRVLHARRTPKDLMPHSLRTKGTTVTVWAHRHWDQDVASRASGIVGSNSSIGLPEGSSIST